MRYPARFAAQTAGWGRLTVFILLATELANAQSPAIVGDWDPPFPLPLIAIHSAVLPTGKVLLFSAEHGVPGIHGWVMDPQTLALTNVQPPDPWNPDCAGHSFLSDGRLLVAGGTVSFTPLTGSKLAFLFDPYGEQWIQIDDMAGGRWYPSCVTLRDGRVITMAGLSDVPSIDNADIEVFDPFSNATWQLLGNKSLPYYPLLHLLPGGKVFMAGPKPQTESYDPMTNIWIPVDTTNFPGRYEACSVALPPNLNRVMLIGGHNGSSQPTNTAEIIDLSSPSPQWTMTSHMGFPRMNHNAVLLPNGNVLVIGGRSDFDGTPTPVLTPEIYDPASATWVAVAPHLIPRRYHSTAVLLPDGRVLSAGGDYEPSGEIYSPAYLFNGPRPVIESAPPTIAFGSSFSVAFTGTTSTHSAVLMSLPAVTHSNNMTQRLVPLGTIPASGGQATLTAPPDGTIAPPGFYMLFILSSNGIPSVSKMVRLTDAPGQTPWSDLGSGIAGTKGVPLVIGSGSLQPNSPVAVSLLGALPNTTATLVIGTSQLGAPFLGGILVPAPDFLITLSTGGNGTFTLASTWPPGVPSGFTFWIQAWIFDPAGPAGFAASPAVAGTAP